MILVIVATILLRTKIEKVFLTIVDKGQHLRWPHLITVVTFIILMIILRKKIKTSMTIIAFIKIDHEGGLDVN